MFSLFKTKKTNEKQVAAKSLAISNYHTNPDDFEAVPTTSLLQIRALTDWTYVAISKIAEQLFSLEARLYDPDGHPVEKDPVKKFFTRPNKYEHGPVFMYKIAFHLLAAGKCLIRYKDGDFYIIPDPTAVRIQTSPDGTELLGFEYTAITGVVTYRPDEIIYLRIPHPFKNFESYSKLEAILKSLNLQDKFQNVLKEILGKPIPMQALAVEDSGAARLVKEQISLAKLEGSIPIIPKAQAVQLERTPEQMQLIAAAESIRDDILVKFGVPPAVLGVYKDVNRANGLEARRTFRDNTVAPLVKFIEQSLQAELIDETLGLKGYTLELRIPDLIDEEFELQKITAYLDRGVITINEVRQMEGMEAVAYGNRPFMPANLMPMAAQNPARLPQGHRKDVDDIKTKNWENMVEQLREVEPTITKIWRRIFKAQRRAVLDFIERFKNAPAGVTKDFGMITLILNEAAADYEAELRETLARAYLERAYQFISIFRLNSPNISPAFLQAALNRIIRINLINDVTERQIREAIVTGIQNGETMDEIADRIADIFNFADEYRALRIARTETIGTSNMAALDSLIANDVEYKEWFTALDERVRPSHQALHGQIVRVLDHFTSPLTGAAILYPGDPDAPPEETINCRCTIVPAEGPE
jgi:HK97 family phage portal protein